MTRFLKLVRHEDGKWKALPTETDDLAQVSIKERLYAPIDPDQLLKALDSLLSKSGGIKSVEDVPRLARYVFICHGTSWSPVIMFLNQASSCVIALELCKKLCSLGPECEKYFFFA